MADPAAKAGYIARDLRPDYERRWEESRAEDLLARMALRQRKKLFLWSAVRGLVEHPFSGAGTAAEPGQVLDEVSKSKDMALFVLKDFHPYLQEAKIIRRLRDLVGDLKASYKTMIILSPFLTIPTELEKDITIQDYDLPGPEEMTALVKATLSQTKGKIPFDGEVEHLDVLVLDFNLGVTVQIPGQRREAQWRKQRVLDGPPERARRLRQRRQDHLDLHR